MRIVPGWLDLPWLRRGFSEKRGGGGGRGFNDDAELTSYCMLAGLRPWLPDLGGQTCARRTCERGWRGRFLFWRVEWLAEISGPSARATSLWMFWILVERVSQLDLRVRGWNDARVQCLVY